MATLKDFQNQIATIENFQSTFIVLKIKNKLLHFDFRNKKEAFLNQKKTGKLNFYEHHPLLTNYNESNHEVFINSKPENHEMFIEDLKKAINEVTQGFRNWKDYIESDTGTNYQIFLKNIQKGSGLLLKAPFSIIEKIETVCRDHKVKISYFGEIKFTENQLLMINDQFVIAEQFRYKL
nr:hypothetical protein [uncultured Chryseobacterium sp.]